MKKTLTVLFLGLAIISTTVNAEGVPAGPVLQDESATAVPPDSTLLPSDRMIMADNTLPSTPDTDAAPETTAQTATQTTQDIAADTAEGTIATGAGANESDTGLLAFSVGAYDATQQDDAAALVHVEYRFSDQNKIWVLTPFIGAMATTDSALYGYFGLGYDWRVGDNWYIFPSTAVGGYSHGNGKDLGHGIEFRSGIEAGIESDSGERFGVGFHHLSNASLGDRNPGTETISLTYGVRY